jgi:lipoprotein-anchoring transpeptidase ErfK/SrfK/TolA-binding protein
MKSSKKGLFAGILFTVVLCIVAAGLYMYLQRKMIRDSMNQLAAAKTLYESSQWPKAEQLFLEISKKYPRTEAAPESIYHAALLMQAGGRYPEALEQWKKLSPAEGSPRAVETEYYISQCYEKLGKKQEALAGYTKVAAAPASEFSSMAKCGLGRIAEAEGKIEDAHARYEEAMAQAKTKDALKESERLLGRANLEIFLTPVESPDKKVYLVKRGDSLVTIALANNTTVDLICRINGITDATALRPSMRLLIPTAEFSIVINKPEFKLTLLNRGKFFKSYTVGLGKHGCTPLGDFVINDKQKNPVWWSPEGPIPAGDPHNELGTRWMALKPLTQGVGNDYGIHGTINPSTVGWESSNGCPRMLPAEAEELYMLVTIGTPVQIKA